MKITHLLPVMVCIVLLALGCGSAKNKSYECSGTVTLDGQPVENANVSFINFQKSAPATARTDSAGKFTLTSESGNFSVTIVKLTGNATAEDPYAPSKNLLPQKYADMKTSGMKAVVGTDSAKNVFEFKMEK